MKSLISVVLIVMSASAYGAVPQEIQGEWTPDIEKSVALMKKNMTEVNAAYMREKYLPRLRKIITKNRYTHFSGKRKFKAEISLKRKQGDNFEMILSGGSGKDLILTFVPLDGGRFLMKTQNPADGSGNIVWKK